MALIKAPFSKGKEKKTRNVTRWIVGVFFALFVTVTGFHYSSLFLLCAAFLMLPLPFMNAFWQKRNIKTNLVIILSVVLLFVGVMTSPPTEPDEPSDNPSQAVMGDADDRAENTTKPGVTTTAPTTTAAPVTTTKKPVTTAKPVTTTEKPVTTTKPATTTAKQTTTSPIVTTRPVTTKPAITDKPVTTTAYEEKIEMVWIPSSGTKYHSRSNCSGMKSPRQVSLEYAQGLGFSPCKRCH